MKTICTFIGEVVVAFTAAVVIDRTVEATHRWWVSRKNPV
jgi:hypothetical protein